MSQEPELLHRSQPCPRHRGQLPLDGVSFKLVLTGKQDQHDEDGGGDGKRRSERKGKDKEQDCLLCVLLPPFTKFSIAATRHARTHAAGERFPCSAEAASGLQNEPHFCGLMAYSKFVACSLLCAWGNFG